MAAEVWIGTSGFVYPHWRHGVFYPEGLPQKRELEHFSACFRTVELNNPFYRLPDRETFEHWKQRTPPDFAFAVKASRFITHVRRLRDCRDPVRTFLDRARGLGRKLGPVLFQLPPTMGVDLDRLEGFIRALPPRRRYVLEVRHTSWLDDAVYDRLRRRGIALCIAVGGAVEPADLPVTGGFVYVRMHAGRGKDGNFTRSQLEEWADPIRRLRRDGRDVYVYFNNDWQGLAVRNAQTLRALLQLDR